MADTTMVFDQAGQPSVEAVVETFDFVGGVVFHLTQIDQGFDDGAVSPDVGSAQIIHAQNLDVFKSHVQLCEWVGTEAKDSAATACNAKGYTVGDTMAAIGC
jgi:hypothetical protein